MRCHGASVRGVVRRKQYGTFCKRSPDTHCLNTRNEVSGAVAIRRDYGDATAFYDDLGACDGQCVGQRRTPIWGGKEFDGAAELTGGGCTINNEADFRCRGFQVGGIITERNDPA